MFAWSELFLSIALATSADPLSEQFNKVLLHCGDFKLRRQIL